MPAAATSSLPTALSHAPGPRGPALTTLVLAHLRTSATLLLPPHSHPRLEPQLSAWATAYVTVTNNRPLSGGAERAPGAPR